MRVLALDYGSARCGCAISDLSGVIATPLTSIANPDGELGMSKLLGLVAQLEAERIVIGMPVSLSGHENEQALKTRAFIDRVASKVSIPVSSYDERFTTKLAQRTLTSVRKAGGRSKTDEDSAAAAHLLSSYLDAERSK